MLTEAVIVAAIGVLGVLGTPVVRHALQQRKTVVMHRGIMKGLEATRTVYGLLHEIHNTTTADRVILFAGHNSGGVPRPHSPFYVSALHWVCNSQDRASLIRDYVSLVVDAPYITMLLDAKAQGFVTVTTETMPECHLKQIYESENVTQALIFFVAITENKFLFLSAAKYEGTFQEHEVTRIRVKVMKMQPHLY